MQPVVRSSWDCRYQARAGECRTLEPWRRAEFGQAVRRWRDRLAPRRPGCPRAATGARPGCAARNWPCWPGSRSTTSPGWSRAGPPARRRRSSRRWPGRCGCPAPNGRTCSGWPGCRRRAPSTCPATSRASVQRLLDRLTGTPVAVYDATWTLLLANPQHAALIGDQSGWRGIERNGVWRHFLGTGPPGPAVPRKRWPPMKTRWSPTCARLPPAIGPTAAATPDHRPAHRQPPIRRTLGFRCRRPSRCRPARPSITRRPVR